jgi:3-hydroxybutyrate dehydrogenase
VKVMLLEGKRAFITGSTGGIGLGIATALAQAGCDVALNGRKATPQTDELVRQLTDATHRKVVYIPADMSQPSQIRAAIQSCEQALDKIDILVNNAGIQHVEPLHTFPEDKWDMVIAINLSAAFHTTKAVLPAMKAQRWGRIINVASAHGLVASAYKSAYVAAKHGLVGLTKVTALEVAEKGITCNAICPGYVWTPLVEKQIPDQMKAHSMSREEVIHEVLLSNQPNKRFATVEEMGALAVFLASEGAASMTGAAIPVDGGWVAH